MDPVWRSVRPARCRAPGLARQMGFSVVSFHADIKPSTQEINESSEHLRMLAPRFKAKAKVSVPALPRGEAWEIGWIQGARKATDMSIYGSRGYTLWELPEIAHKGQPLVCDTSGLKYPWYCNDSEGLAQVYGPCSAGTVFTVTMTDQVLSPIRWHSPQQRTAQKIHDLTEVKTDVRLFTWLAARNRNTSEVFPLKTVLWGVNVHIGVDCRRPIGKRSFFISNDWRQPIIKPHALPLHDSALRPPCANNAQQNTWHPTNSKPVMLSPPIFHPIDSSALSELVEEY